MRVGEKKLKSSYAAINTKPMPDPIKFLRNNRLNDSSDYSDHRLFIHDKQNGGPTGNWGL